MLTPILMLPVYATGGALGVDFSLLSGTRIGVQRNPLLVFEFYQSQV